MFLDLVFVSKFNDFMIPRVQQDLVWDKRRIEC